MDIFEDTYTENKLQSASMVPEIQFSISLLEINTDLSYVISQPISLSVSNVRKAQLSFILLYIR